MNPTYKCYCPHCGKELSGNAAFCQFCGKAVSAPAAPQGGVPAPKKEKNNSMLYVLIGALSALVIALCVLVVVPLLKDSGNEVKEPSATLSSHEAFTQAPSTEEIPTETEDPFLNADIPDDAFYYNGHYYYIFSEDYITDWDSAAAYCLERGGYLADISDKDENTVLNNHVKESGLDRVYFGLSKPGFGGNWAWYNGEEASFTNWGGTAPNKGYACFTKEYSDGRWAGGDFQQGANDYQAIPISYASASSEWKETYISHTAGKIIDGDLTTAWFEDVPEWGKNEYVGVRFDGETEVVGMSLYLGYHKSEEYYKANNRPKRLQMNFSDGTTEYFDFSDTYEPQDVFFASPKNLTWMTFVLKEVYFSYDRQATGISEVIFYTPKNTGTFLCEWG